MKKKTASEMVYKMFSFQYKPLEEKLFKYAPPYFKEKYEKLPVTQKIIVLDRYASTLGL